jgi:hypothetical protein
MDKKNLEDTERIIKILMYAKKLLRPEEIENELIDKVLRSLKRKIDMGENPYKFKSSSACIYFDTEDDLRWLLDDEVG